MRVRAVAPWIRIVLVVIFMLAALVVLVVVLINEPPDETITGEVTSVETHRICVRSGDRASICAHVDAPQRLGGIERGDCVRLTVSADGELEEVTPTDGCR
jgi:hypothetical protein